MDHLDTQAQVNELQQKVSELETEHAAIKQTESAFRRLNRTLNALSEGERVLTRSNSEQELFSGLCDLLVEVSGFRLAWIGIADNDIAKTVRPVAYNGFEDGYLENIRISWSDDEFGQGPTGSAIRTGEAVIARDILSNGKYKPWRDEALKRGYASSIALPFFVENKIRGALNIYAKETDAFDEDEVNLLYKLIEELTYGLKSLWERQQRIKTQKKLEAAVKERVSIMESIPDIVYKLDTNAKLLLWNKQLERVLDYTESELDGINAIELFVDADRPKVQQAIQRAFTEGYADVEARLLTRGGTPIYFHFSGSPLFDQQGNVCGLTGVGRDLTQTKKDEEEKNSLQRQLQQAQKMEALGQLTGGIAHDFNNMLSAILGFTSLSIDFLEKGDNKQVSDFLQQVQIAGERARDLIAQMLTFSRTSSGSEMQQIELNQMLEDTIKMLRPVLPSSIGINSKIETNLPLVAADPVKIQQVIMNLCINARDSMNGQGQINLFTNRTSAHEKVCDACHKSFSGNFVGLSVEDSGEGIATELIDRLFEPFFTTKEVGKGTGMGLAMAHGIIHEHGGHIVVETELGKGTTFHLLFPIAESTAAKTENVDTEQSDEFDGSGKHALVVDDEETVGKFIEALLDKYGFKVTTCTNSEQALSVYYSNQTNIDLVVTDQTMPGMTGFEMAQEILADNPDLPIILCTGYNEQINKKKALENGLADFLLKPFSQDKLMNKIKAALQKEKASF